MFKLKATIEQAVALPVKDAGADASLAVLVSNALVQLVEKLNRENSAAIRLAEVEWEVDG